MNRKVFYYIVGILFLCILAYKLFFYLDAIEEKRLVQKNASIVRLSPSQIGQIKEGDIILRRGYGYFSDMIAERLNQKPFDVTHSGIIVKEHGKWIVIHSLSSDVSSINGVQKQALEDFLMHSQPNKLLITRFKSDIIKTNDEINQMKESHNDDLKEFFVCALIIFMENNKEISQMKFKRGKEINLNSTDLNSTTIHKVINIIY